MAIKVAINGYGRIGRNILRALYESNRTNEIQVVAVNDLGDAETNAHLTQYDTAHGRFRHEVSVDGGDLVINGDRIKVFAERDPAKLPWGSLGVDVVYDGVGGDISVESLRWQAPAVQPAGLGRFIAELPLDWTRRTDRLEAYNQAKASAARLHAWLAANLGPEIALQLGLNRARAGAEDGYRLGPDGRPKFEVHSVRPARRVTPDGELLFQSDVFDLALDAMAVLEQEPGLRNVRGEWSFLPQNPYGVQSLREVRVQERGLPVWRMLYRRSGDEAAARAPG